MIEFLVNQGWDKDVATGVALLLGVVAVSTFGLLWIILGIWVERKFAGRVQDRLGPNRTGPYGLFQTFADLGKLLTKEDITPQGADKVIYNMAPLISVGAVLLIWAVVPFSKEWIGSDLNVGALYFTAVGSFGTLAILLAGWGSNNKYALLGAFRVIAQLVSYEVPMVLSILVPVLLSGSMSMQEIVNKQNIWYIFVSPIAALLFFISSLAEVGRSPFDLIEAESEIVAGFNIEYSGMKFGMFYAAEFLHAFTICVLASILFLGGWRGIGAEIPGVAGSLLGFVWLFTKTLGVYFLLMLIRNTVPRIRIDQMMAFNWKFLVPLSLVNLLVVAFVGKILQPDYVGVTAAATASSGLLSLVYQLLGPNLIAEIPRAVVIFIASVILWWLVSMVMQRYAIFEHLKAQTLVKEYKPYSPSPEQPTSAPVPSAGR
ncbi:MAG: NADH-quinone oxidoreductase subunit NuoH [Chloroflexota bacterium]